jgi:tripartite-type tricarboxylate transporter receptor subunit TctC
MIASTAATLNAAHAQNSYPSQPVRMIVATVAGGGLDNFARLLARELSARAGQQFVVDNRAGAGTTIGSAAVAKAKPDGYTILANTAALAISPAIYQKLPYDTLADLAPITLAAATPNMLVAHPSVPAKSVRDVIALARARAAGGDPLLYASGGNGTNGHMAMSLFISVTQAHMTHVPYKSGTPALIDVVSGQVPLMIDSIASVIAQVNAGKLRALGISDNKRSPIVPAVPTFAESGINGAESAQWYGVLAPAGTPADIMAWLYRESIAALRTQSLKERLAAEGLEIVASTPEEFAATLRADIAKWTKVVKITGLSPL